MIKGKLQPVDALLRADEIGIDRTYQRAFVLRWVIERLPHFDPVLLGVITVAIRVDGSRWVVDGQHRLALAIRALGPDAMVRCELIQSSGPVQEAGWFHELNARRRALMPMDNYRSGVAGDDPVCLAIAGALAAIGRSASRHVSGRTTMSGIGTLMRELNGHPLRANALLRYCAEIAGDSAITAGLIRGVNRLVTRIYRDGKLPDEYITRLAAIKWDPTLKRMIARARYETGASEAQMAVVVMVKALNGRKKPTSALYLRPNATDNTVIMWPDELKGREA